MEADIWASQTTSQRLAQAFAANSQPKSLGSAIPRHLQDFEDVFSKGSFDPLPECKQWDHVIKLLPDAEPFSCKVYLLAPQEQDELDVFLQENLDVRATSGGYGSITQLAEGDPKRTSLRNPYARVDTSEGSEA